MESKNDDIKRKVYISQLKSKFADKPWSETFNLVRRCMDKPRADSRSSEPILRCLQKLHEAQNVTSVSGMVARLETIAKQIGLNSHMSPTQTACYLTSDLFYLEVLLLPGGGVEDVKVAQHGEAPESNASLLQLLRMKKFEEFSHKLESIASLYNIPRDSETKVKVYTALQHLQKDLLKISNLPRHLIESDVHVDMVLNGRIGSVTPCREGSPMSIQYYISPSNVLMEMLHPGETSLGQIATVLVGASATTHMLQMESLLPAPPEVDPTGIPVFRPLSEVCSESLPAFFLLKPQTPLPTLNSVMHKMSQITGVAPQADLQGEPLFQLVKCIRMKGKSYDRSSDRNEEEFHTSLPDGELHSYVFRGAEWQRDSWKASLINAIPFTHPAHVPALLDLLRHQSAINVLLESCISNTKHQPGIESGIICEVLPESDYNFSVTFSLQDCLGVLLVSVVDLHRVNGKLLVPGLVDHPLNDYVSRVLTRCMSIPITMRAILKKMTSLESPVPVVSDLSTLTAEASPHTDHLPSERAPNTLPSTLFSPEPMEQDSRLSPSGHYVMSVAAAPVVDSSNTDMVANPSPCASVGVYSHWVASNIPTGTGLG